MLCDWCLVNSGRFAKGRPCCELRALALAPRQVQFAHGKTLTAAECDALRPVLAAEIARLKELKAAKSAAAHDAAMCALDAGSQQVRSKFAAR